MNYDNIAEIRVKNKDGSIIIYKENGIEKFKKMVSKPQEPIVRTNSKYAQSNLNIKPMEGGDVFSNAEQMKISSGLKFAK